MADFWAGFYQPFDRLIKSQIPDQKPVSTVFQDETFTPSSSKIHFSSLKPFYLGNTSTKHNQLPAIIWNFYYDAKKLLQAENCIILAII